MVVQRVGAADRPGQSASGDNDQASVGTGKRKRRRSRARKSKALAPTPAGVEGAANSDVCGTSSASSAGAEIPSDPGSDRPRATMRVNGSGGHRIPARQSGPCANESAGTQRDARRQDGRGRQSGDKRSATASGKYYNGAAKSWPTRARHGNGNVTPRYAALDLGTNNCRLLVAEPREHGFRVVDAFSRIVRLGDGMASSGALGPAAMDRAIKALQVCGRKLSGNGVRKARLIATEACRYAENGAEFLAAVEETTGLRLEIVDRETEARLAVAGCSSLVHPNANGVILFDIGGGSSELVWLDLRQRRHERGVALSRFIRAWMSLPVGVVTLSERFGGVDVTPDVFDWMVDYVNDLMSRSCGFDLLDREFENKQIHLLGTSGTVTTLAGIHLNLERYDRRRVDGLWMSSSDVVSMIDRLVAMNYQERVGNPCIGSDRADLVLAGCAIFEVVRRRWPCRHIRVADRGLREGILMEMMTRDRVWARRGRKTRRPGGKHHSSAHSNGTSEAPHSGNGARSSQ